MEKEVKKILFLLLWSFLFYSCSIKKEKKMDYIELRSGTTIECEAIDKKAFNNYIDKLQGVHIDKYTKKYNIEVYLLNNGEVIVNEDGYYTRYFSLNDLDKIIADFNTGDNSYEVLLNKNPFKDKFPNHTHDLINDLLKQLGLSHNSNFSMDFIKRVDEEISKRNDSSDFKKKYFINLVALVGETMNKQEDTSWQMIIGEDNTTWNPYLIKSNNKIAFFVNLYDDVFINNGENILEDNVLTIKDVIHNNLSK